MMPSHLYSLNSPSGSTPHLAFTSSSSSSSLTSLPSPTSSFINKSRARISAPPPPRRRTASTSATLAPPPLPTVLASPDPENRVRTARRSVQFSKQSGVVNWARPIAPNHENAPAVPPLPPSSFTMRPTATAPLDTPTFGVSRRTSNTGSLSSSSGEDELPTTPRLPPGAVPPEPRAWAVSADLKGLGVSNVPLPKISSVPPPQHPELIARDSEDSLASEAGSLGGESTTTAASSSPSTPTRLFFVSESFDALSKPTSLEELSRLRAAAKQLDLESQRLRRHRGQDPAQVRRLRRKAVPQLTEADLAPADPAPRPRPRAALRHSLIAPPGYSFRVDDEPPRDHPFVAQATTLAEARAIAKLKSQAADGLGAIVPPPSAAARRQAFYSQGKAAQSVIEFSPRKSAWTPPPFLAARANASAHAGHTPASPAAPGPPVTVLPAPLPVPGPGPGPGLESDALPSPTRKASHSFLKNKKLSRLFGKAAA
ncbi:hypothetical protein CC85DRAFT_289889 [Cutaneotrichosporon oleaginosum]|uniref:Uncharacterized protein n=1 Tax=Cutaneotrichosporon oleaginosum TaxID=879819 RepID=A0A0J0XYR8_9TREE|nr:uncharacterized protein CC85DRAFT_289889 [Cutaneotrichosporon oleaginosum]KLT46176.1 hypothetical protein CC85DRAFT_289889 [Cutaneotrichosporon oleaginosum]TXT10185.1 hypothetical protein COLE_04119 [Cutaneotrichosporon oleaginosum]